MANAGKPEHIPDEATRATVISLSSFGVRQDEVAKYLNIDPKTLRKHYRHELDTSLINTTIEVARSLYHNATSNDNAQAQIFWLKTKGGWKETTAIEHTSPDGTMSPKDIDSSVVESLVNKLTD